MTIVIRMQIVHLSAIDIIASLPLIVIVQFINEMQITRGKKNHLYFLFNINFTIWMRSRIWDRYQIDFF
jgi:hypothetical protein